MTLGEKLKSLRSNSGKTLKELGDILGVSLNSVYRWESNLAVPKKAMLVNISEHYDIPVNWLLTEDDGKELIEYLVHSAIPENNLEEQLLKMFRRLCETDQQKVFGYTERAYIENLHDMALY